MYNMIYVYLLDIILVSHTRYIINNIIIHWVFFVYDIKFTNTKTNLEIKIRT